MVIPKLNIAIPRPASEMIFIENATILGIAIPHLLIIHKNMIKVNNQIID